MAEGVTTLEIKSGYGLSLSTRRRCLRVARRLGARAAADGAHDLPGGARAAARVRGPGRRLHRRGLRLAAGAARAKGWSTRSTPSASASRFTPAQTRRVFEAARALGLPVKLHAEQLSDSGGAALAAEFGALSLRPPRAPERRRRARRWRRPAASRCCCPAPTTSCARRRLPPVAALRDAGVPIAIATDHNPGSSPTLSPLLMLNMACTLFRLTPEEALRGVTRERGARARPAPTAACSRPGSAPTSSLWDVEHPNELAYWFGHNPLRAGASPAARNGRRR